MKISGKSALVTGGASGLGAATVRMLASCGARIVIADINDKAGADLALELGEPVKFVRTDVTNDAEVERAVGEAVQCHGGLHVVVNAAGIAIAEKLVGKAGPHDLERFQRVVQVNLVATFNMIRRAAAAMMLNAPEEDGARGVIVNTASVAAFEGQIGQVAYSASKAGIVGMTLPLARELAAHGIRVIAVAPGIFHTPMLGNLPEPVLASLGQQVPFPSRLGRPAEYASLVQHILENNMINGATIRLDGAIRMAAK
jgi:NAD(P)-dependent dehydrogenase (short-subunit alcohol dehydrogenase family)